MGIGNPLNGDDAAGVVAIQRLRKVLRRGGATEEGISGDASSFFQRKVVLIEANQAPENFTGLLRQISPQIVFLIDAAWMDCAPGTICVIPWQEVGGFSASTHVQPPSMFARYLTEQIGCQVFTLGIQPQSLEFGSPLTLPVQRSVNRLVRELSRSFSGNNVISQG